MCNARPRPAALKCSSTAESNDCGPHAHTSRVFQSGHNWSSWAALKWFDALGMSLAVTRQHRLVAVAMLVGGQLLHLRSEDDVVAVRRVVDVDDIGHVADDVPRSKHAHHGRHAAAGGDEQWANRRGFRDEEVALRQTDREITADLEIADEVADIRPPSSTLTVTVMQPSRRSGEEEME